MQFLRSYKVKLYERFKITFHSTNNRLSSRLGISNIDICKITISLDRMYQCKQNL